MDGAMPAGLHFYLELKCTLGAVPAICRDRCMMGRSRGGARNGEAMLGDGP